MKAKEFDALLADCAAPDDLTYRVIACHADLWGHALTAADRLGYERGHADGYRAAEQEMALAWRHGVQNLKAFWKASDAASEARRRSGVA